MVWEKQQAMVSKAQGYSFGYREPEGATHLLNIYAEKQKESMRKRLSVFGYMID